MGHTGLPWFSLLPLWEPVIVLLLLSVVIVELLLRSAGSLGALPGHIDQANLFLNSLYYTTFLYE